MEKNSLGSERHFEVISDVLNVTRYNVWEKKGGNYNHGEICNRCSVHPATRAANALKTLEISHKTPFIDVAYKLFLISKLLTNIRREYSEIILQNRKSASVLTIVLRVVSQIPLKIAVRRFDRTWLLINYESITYLRKKISIVTIRKIYSHPKQWEDS